MLSIEVTDCMKLGYHKYHVNIFISTVSEYMIMNVYLIHNNTVYNEIWHDACYPSVHDEMWL